MLDAASIFLLVFIVALGLTLVSFAFGVVGVHLPGADHGHGLHLDHSGAHAHGGVHANGGLHAPGSVHGHLDHGGGAPGPGHDLSGDISPFNMSTILAFLTWFGGAGYLLTAHFGVATIAALLIAAGVGGIGASIVFFFLARILLRGQTPFLRDEDYRMEGTIGRLSVGVRGGRTGEVVYSKAGTRRVASAKSADGRDIEQGAEVVVIQHERGIAYVQRFEELLAEEPQSAAQN